jgi:hypothetical protein
MRFSGLLTGLLLVVGEESGCGLCHNREKTVGQATGYGMCGVSVLELVN